MNNYPTIDHFWAKSKPLLFEALQSSEQGLPVDIAQEHVQAQLKSRKIESRFTREAKLLIAQFTNPLVLLLLVAVILSALLGEVSDTFIILSILLVTGFIGFFQELNAGRAVEKLQNLIALKHDVLRNGQPLQVTTDEVVPGDILRFRAGDIIPADCRIIESNELHINESILTGESFAVEKTTDDLPADTALNQRVNCLWKGTNVISGTGLALVIFTGDNTIFGQMAHSLLQTPETAFEKGIKHFGYFLLRITIVLSIIILSANLYFHKPIFDAILFSLALAVGMAPELLPAIMTFSMAAGARKMMQKKVIVKKLSSIFSFGETTILCTDKTGTITEGTVAVKNVLNYQGQPDEQLKFWAFLNAAFQNGFNNPIDEALKSFQFEPGQYQKINEVPYDFIRKRLSVLVQNGEQKTIITKGALVNVLEVCTELFDAANRQTQPLTEEWKTAIERQYTQYSQDGYRVLGLCCKTVTQEKITRQDETNMAFAGFILLEDPLKESAVGALQRLNNLGVAIKIITGDNQHVAKHAAQQIGIAQPNIITGDMLDQMSPEALTVNALQAHVFAEIDPHQKEIIVKALQKSHQAVAYIGDGINDVAAIHAADVGVSTANAVDVAKEAADFVLLEKDLSVLTDGIVEGRKSFANSMKYIFITTGATFGNMLSVAVSSLMLPFLPMLPKQLLLTNLLTDLPFLTVATDNVDEAQLQKPRKWDIGVIKKFMIVFGLHSSIFDFLTFFTLLYLFRLSGSFFQTGWFVESIVTELLIIFIIRTPKPVFSSRPAKSLIWLALLAILITFWLPISPFAGWLSLQYAHSQQAAAIVAILTLYFFTGDWLKRQFFKYVYKQNSI